MASPLPLPQELRSNYLNKTVSNKTTVCLWSSTIKSCAVDPHQACRQWLNTRRVAAMIFQLSRGRDGLARATTYEDIKIWTHLRTKQWMWIIRTRCRATQLASQVINQAAQSSKLAIAHVPATNRPVKLATWCPFCPLPSRSKRIIQWH